MIKTSPKKKKCKKAKWLSEEALQIAVKRREATGKGENERYTYLNAEFQRIERRHKVFLSDQCQEIKENNRMEKTRDLFNKIRDTKGTFDASQSVSLVTQLCLTLCNPMDYTPGLPVHHQLPEFTQTHVL